MRVLQAERTVPVKTWDMLCTGTGAMLLSRDYETQSVGQVGRG